MPSSRVRITVRGLQPWIDGLETFGTPTPEMELRWRQATDTFFDRTQRFVHVETAELKSSGRYEMFSDRRNIVGQVAYGGTAECDYAVYEFARGGNHDALTRGFEASQRMFERTLARMLAEEVGGWK